MTDPIAFAASTTLVILYIHQTMHTLYHSKFIESMATEIQGHKQMGNFIPLPLSHNPKGIKRIDMVWSMHHKHQIKIQEIYKWKVQLNVHGGQQDSGVHYWETYAPVVMW